MTQKHKVAVAGLVALGLLLVGSAVQADSEGVPSFKTSKDKETKEFVGKVFESIVKAARLKPKNVKLDKHEFVKVKDKENRKELNMTGTYDGQAIAKNVKVNITVQLDTSKADAWEVLNIDYKDANKVSFAKPNQTNIQALIKNFNK